MDSVANFAIKAAKAFEKAYLRVKDPDTDAENPEGVGSRKMIVQYNPAKLRISTRAGSFQQPVVGSAITTYNQITIPPQTVLDVELIMEDVNNQDAFMFDKITGQSPSALMDDVKGGYASVTGDGCSVQKQVEGIIGLMMNPYTRQVVFGWSDMEFRGELTAVTAAYTMFNPVGNPIFARVNLSIQQNNPTKEVVDYWSKAFENTFGEQKADGTVVNGNYKVDAARNWINI